MQDELNITAEELAEVEALRQRLAVLEPLEPDFKQALHKVLEREEHNRTAVDNVTDAIVINVATTRVFVNNAFLALHGLDDTAEVSGLTLDHFILPEDREMVSERTLARQRGEPTPGVYEYRIRRTNGAIRTVEASAVAITYDGQPATLAVLRDITERKQAEEQVECLAEIGRIIGSSLNIDDVYRPFAERVRSLLPFDRIVITTADQEHDTFTTAYVMGDDVAEFQKGQVATLTGSVTQEIIRTRTGLLTGTKGQDELGNRFPGLLLASRAGFRSFMSVPLISSDEVVGVLHLVSSTPDAYTEHDLNLAMGIGAQISGAIANSKLFEELEEGRERMRWLTRQVVTAQEEERHRVSQELHDEAGQALTALKITLDLLHSDLQLPPGPLREQIESATDLADNTMENIRLLARGLRPPELDAVGLDGTLEGFCREFAELTRLSIDYAGLEIPGLPDTVNISMYRFVQEALTNVAKHAQANRVLVELRRDADTVSLSVTDDGRGLVPSIETPESPYPKGIGLLGMQERFEVLGGRLEIKSKPGEGTRLAAYVPWNEQQ